MVKKKLKWVRVRKNVKQYVDMDYLSSLKGKDKDFMINFIDEYYSGSFNKKDSLHRKAFGDDYEEKKVEFYLNNNAQNRDTYSILNGAKMIQSIELLNDIEMTTTEISNLLSKIRVDGEEVFFKNLMNEAIDEIECARDDQEKLVAMQEYTKTIMMVVIANRKSKSKISYKLESTKNKVTKKPGEK